MRVVFASTIQQLQHGTTQLHPASLWRGNNTQGVNLYLYTSVHTQYFYINLTSTGNGGSLQGGKAVGSVELIISVHLAPRLRTGGAVPPIRL